MVVVYRSSSMCHTLFFVSYSHLSLIQRHISRDLLRTSRVVQSCHYKCDMDADSDSNDLEGSNPYQQRLGI